MNFTAIDFETANYDPHSACALAMVKVRAGQVVDQWHALIRPPSDHFVFTYLHGIGAKDVRQAKTFAEHWPAIRAFCQDAPVLAAHNADFDRRVLAACCTYYQVTVPRYRFVCTVQVSRRTWPALRRHSLDSVCRKLGLALDHHQAESDALACAKILMRAVEAGCRVSSWTK